MGHPPQLPLDDLSLLRHAYGCTARAPHAAPHVQIRTVEHHHVESRCLAPTDVEFRRCLDCRVHSFGERVDGCLRRGPGLLCAQWWEACVIRGGETRGPGTAACMVGRMTCAALQCTLRPCTCARIHERKVQLNARTLTSASAAVCMHAYGPISAYGQAAELKGGGNPRAIRIRATSRSAPLRRTPATAPAQTWGPRSGTV